MKKISLIYLILTIWTPFLTAQKPAEAFESRWFRTSFDSILPFRILFPKNFDSKKRYPIVFFMHGRGESGSDNTAQLQHGATLFLNPANRDSFPCIVVFPQCPTHDYWSNATIDRSVNPHRFQFDYQKPMTNALRSVSELMDSLVKTPSVDSRKVYLMGLSMGGMATFELTARFPKRFAAGLPICGAGDPKNLPRKIRRIPFWVFHGAADPVVGVQESLTMIGALQNKGATVRYSEYPKIGHDSWTNAFAEPDLMKWIFSHQKR